MGDNTCNWCFNRRASDVETKNKTKVGRAKPTRAAWRTEWVTACSHLPRWVVYWHLSCWNNPGIPGCYVRGKRIRGDE